MSLLKTLMVDTKSAWIEYPGFDGFEVEVATLSRPELISLRKSCIVSKWDKKTRQPVETLDDDKFVRKFSEKTIKDWKGLKYKFLESLIPVDISKVDPEDELPFSVEDAEILIKNSSDFDTWINEVVFDLDNFRAGREGSPVEAPEPVAV